MFFSLCQNLVERLNFYKLVMILIEAKMAVAFLANRIKTTNHILYFYDQLTVAFAQMNKPLEIFLFLKFHWGYCVILNFKATYTFNLNWQRYVVSLHWMRQCSFKLNYENLCDNNIVLINYPFILFTVMFSGDDVRHTHHQPLMDLWQDL